MTLWVEFVVQYLNFCLPFSVVDVVEAESELAGTIEGMVDSEITDVPRGFAAIKKFGFD